MVSYDLFDIIITDPLRRLGKWNVSYAWLQHQFQTIFLEIVVVHANLGEIFQTVKQERIDFDQLIEV